jgi:hypothetical protein
MTHLDDKTASTDVDVEDFARAFTLNVTNVAGLTFALLPGREHLAAFTPDGGEHGIGHGVPRDQRRRRLSVTSRPTA